MVTYSFRFIKIVIKKMITYYKKLQVSMEKFITASGSLILTWISGLEVNGDLCRFLFCVCVLTQGTFALA